MNCLGSQWVHTPYPTRVFPGAGGDFHEQVRSFCLPTPPVTWIQSGTEGSSTSYFTSPERAGRPTSWGRVGWRDSRLEYRTG